MTSRERVLRALNHQETDRPPVDFGGCVVTCIDRDAHSRLCRHHGFEAESPIIDYTMGTVVPDVRLQELYNTDVRRVGMNVIPPGITDGIFYNGFGIKHRQAPGHLYFDVVEHPLAEAGTDDLDAMTMPNPDNPALYAGLKERAKDLRDRSEYGIFADFGVPGFYETCQKLRGYEQFACDLLLEKDFVHALFSHLLELQKRFFKNYLNVVGGYAHVIGYADDLGMQDRPQISTELYREMIMPYHKEIFSYIHNLCDIKICLHCCGAVEPLIESLIEAGIDILNPVQLSASGMDAAALKERYGGRVVFWGGIDEQALLCQGTTEEIADQAKKLKGIFGKGGGYVAAVSHNIQADTPPENIDACFFALTK